MRFLKLEFLTSRCYEVVFEVRICDLVGLSNDCSLLLEALRALFLVTIVLILKMFVFIPDICTWLS